MQRTKSDEARQGDSGENIGRPKSPTIADFITENGLLKQGHRSKKEKQGEGRGDTLLRTGSADKLMMSSTRKNKHGQPHIQSSHTTEHINQKKQENWEPSGYKESALKHFEKPNYFKELEEGEYGGHTHESGDDMEEDPGLREMGEGPSKPPDNQAGSSRKAGEELIKRKEGISTPTSTTIYHVV